MKKVIRQSNVRANLGLTAAGLLSLLAVSAAQADTARPAPKVPPALQPLPPGAIEPAGWLRDWALAARHGITGHLDERHSTFAEGWKGTPIQAPGAKPDGTGWPIEQSAYWLDGALQLGFALHDEALIRKIRARLDPIVDGVNRAEAGITFIYWKPGFKPEGFESWAHSHLGRALVALYRGTGEKRVLDALVKVYADYPVNLGEIPLGGDALTGICNLDPMLETYALSGDQRILDRALQALARPSVAGDIAAWTKGEKLAPGHMVIFYENMRLPALAFPWSGDPTHLRATQAAFDWIDAHHLQPYGVSSGEEFASGVGAFRKTETCTVTAMLLASSWMYRVQGHGDWGDRMEHAFFNAGAAPVARDFQTMSYYQSPNRLRSDSLPDEQVISPGPGGNRFSSLGCPDVLCCVGAINRILPLFIHHAWMATPDRGLAATLYAPCTVTARVTDGVSVKVVTATDYPFNETLRLTVTPAQPVAFPLHLRIPRWCQEPRLTLNGKQTSARANREGFVKLSRTWKAGDVVELRLPMTPEVKLGHETEVPSVNRKYFGFRFEAYFQPRRAPFASVHLGPLLFALPIPDLDPNNPVPDTRWQFALDVAQARGSGGIAVERQPMPARWDWPLASPLTLKAPARAIAWNPTDVHGLPDQPVEGSTAETLRLVPYGCTKFRISMFPVASETVRK